MIPALGASHYYKEVDMSYEKEMDDMTGEVKFRAATSYLKSRGYIICEECEAIVNAWVVNMVNGVEHKLCGSCGKKEIL